MTEALPPWSPPRDRNWLTINRREFIEGAALVAGSVAVTGALALAG